MYCNLAKGQVFPLVIRVSSKSTWLKQKARSVVTLKPSLSTMCSHFTTLSKDFEFLHKSNQSFNLVRRTESSTGFQCKSREMGNIAGARSMSSGFKLRSSLHWCPMLRARGFSSSNSQTVGKGSNAVRAETSFPWLSSDKVKEAKGFKKGASAMNSGSSWEEAAKRWQKFSGGSLGKESTKRSEIGAAAKNSSSSWEESAKRLEKGAVTNAAQSSWEDLAETDNYMVGIKESRNTRTDVMKGGRNGYKYIGKNDNLEEEEEEDLEDQGEDEVPVDDPRWNKIKNRLGMWGGKGRSDNHKAQRWEKQENWGRQTWRKATESSIPKMVGEGVYGVGPVLAALSSARREFYALYVQEGLDLSGNNRKKKDKKGFEKVLKMAEKIGLSIKELSKHDLNMIVDSRPHQGLVLDASPLEMVKIKELEPVMSEEEKNSLWIALDEITDPQNLGAIIRSAYFFGASGVVLCAKNSAPLSGVVSKASAGSLEVMELRYCKNMMQFLVLSGENGWRVLGASVSSKGVPVKEVLPGEPTILVLGNEGTGLRPLVERSCTQLIQIPGKIPMNIATVDGDSEEAEETKLEHSNEDFRSFLAVESLNVSVAAGVLIHHLIGDNHNGNQST